MSAQFRQVSGAVRRLRTPSAGLTLALTAVLSAGSDATEFRFPTRWPCWATGDAIELATSSRRLIRTRLRRTSFGPATDFSAADWRRGLVFQGKEAQPQARLGRRPTVKPLAMGQRCDPRRCAPRWRQWPFGRVQDPKVRSDLFGLRSTTPQPTRLTSNASPRTFAAKASFAGRSMLRIRSVRSWVSQKASFPRDRSR